MDKKLQTQIFDVQETDGIVQMLLKDIFDKIGNQTK